MGIYIQKKNLFRRRRWRQQRKNVSSKTSLWVFAAQSENPISSSFSPPFLCLRVDRTRFRLPGCPRSIPFGFLGFRSPPRFELPLTKGGGERKVKLTRRKKKELWARTQTDASSAYAPKLVAARVYIWSDREKKENPFHFLGVYRYMIKVGPTPKPTNNKKRNAKFAWSFPFHVFGHYQHIKLGGAERDESETPLSL